MKGRVLVAGAAAAPALLLDEPLSFWGGYDPSHGVVADVHHPQHGAALGGRIVVMPYARGSSSTANTLAESIHRGTGPAGILLLAADEMIVLGATVVGELYGEWIPVVVLPAEEYAAIASGDLVQIAASGEVTVG